MTTSNGLAFDLVRPWFDEIRPFFLECDASTQSGGQRPTRHVGGLNRS
jgi:hypothetical protein